MGNYSSFLGSGRQPLSQHSKAPTNVGYGEDQCLCKEVCTSDFTINITTGVVGRNRWPWEVEQWYRKISLSGHKTTKKVCYRGNPDLDLPDERPGVCFENPEIEIKEGKRGAISRITIKGGEHTVTKYLGGVNDCSDCHSKMEGCKDQEEIIAECNTEKLEISVPPTPTVFVGAREATGWKKSGCGKGMIPPFEVESINQFDDYGDHQWLADLLMSVGDEMSKEEADRFANTMRNPDHSHTKQMCRLLLTLRCCCSKKPDPEVECPKTFEPCCNCESPVQETE